MSNFLFDQVKVQMANGSGDFNWINDTIYGHLYDSRLIVLPTMDWAALSSYEVAVSQPMGGRTVGPDGRLHGDTLQFDNVTTQPGLRIKGLILTFSATLTTQPIVHFDSGLDGFSGNDDLNLEANGIQIFARTSASNDRTWIAL